MRAKVDVYITIKEREKLGQNLFRFHKASKACTETRNNKTKPKQPKTTETTETNETRNYDL